MSIFIKHSVVIILFFHLLAETSVSDPATLDMMTPICSHTYCRLY